MLFFLEELTTPMMIQSLSMSDFCILQIFVAISIDFLKISNGHFLSLHKIILSLFLKFTLKCFLQLGFEKHYYVIFHRNRAIALLDQPHLLSSPFVSCHQSAQWNV